MPSLRPALMSWGRRWGAVQSLQLAKASNPTASHAQKITPIGKAISKWPESKDAVEAQERTQGAAVLGLEGR